MTEHLICPACKSGKLIAKYEAKYVYSYRIDADAPGLNNGEEFLPFLYDRREQEEARQFIECESCGTQYPCFFTEGNGGVLSRVFHKAVGAETSANSEG
jgi:hypothetical protein